jgi:hypothetical protein
MIVLNVTPRKTRLYGDFEQYRKHLRQLRGDLLKQEACLTARAALKFAPPLVEGGGKGDTAAAGRTGMEAVAADIKSIFAIPGSTLSSVFAGSRASKSHFAKWRQKSSPKTGTSVIKDIHSDEIEDRAWQYAKNLYGNREGRHMTPSSLAEMAKLHRAERRKGVVRRTGGPSDQVRRYPHIARQALINKYIKLRQRAVGKLKAGWWGIINAHGRNLTISGRTADAGAKGLPGYITRHRMNTGSMRVVNSPNAGRITIRNDIGDNDGAGMKADTVIMVTSYRQMQVASRPPQRHINRFVRNWNTNQRAGA